jgi:hypothetical protein
MTQQSKSPINEITLDVGHSSIGWAVFLNNVNKNNDNNFELCGMGVVLFPADDCLASKRRVYRHQRRHIRSTRQRIERLKQLLQHINVLSESKLNQSGCAWPWKLAAEALRDSGRFLTWPELWDVLRWYAHNRGYDGNARWSRLEDHNSEDTKKEQEADRLMKKHNSETMAETFCAVLKINPLGVTKSSQERFKGLNAAFPRKVVYAEVKKILEKHVGTLPQLTSELIRALVGRTEKDDNAWKTVEVPYVCLPKRYVGSYLFGQSVPRFDNRIISACPITYEQVFSRVLAETDDIEKARHQAIRGSKVPAKKCREFLLYRWAMIMANLRVDEGQGPRMLTAKERQAIHQVMVEAGGRLTKKQLKEAVKQTTDKRWWNNVDDYFLTPKADEVLILRPDKNKLPTGRAPYTRAVLKEAVREIFEGKDPTVSGGCLYQSEDIKRAQLERALEEKTNNHLVRHRVFITRKLVQDIIKAYAKGNAFYIRRITIEVNRDLQMFSGLSAKEIEKELNSLLKDHSNVVKKLKEDLGEKVKPSLIRKARIAADLGWKCPYTRIEYDAKQLSEKFVDKDHIIPRSLRSSDSLESLVITFSWVNKMKGNRTALQFIKECGGNSELSTEAQYRKFVEGLDTKTGHAQDVRRKKERQKLLLLERHEDKDFLPKDLTQTSHLVRLAAMELKKEFIGLENKLDIISLPGFVTGEMRKRWDLYGCLAAHNSEVQKIVNRAKSENLNVKKELRGITHLHHALDACVLGYASHSIPKDLWKILVKRHRCPEENNRLVKETHGIFSRDGDGHARLREFKPEWKKQIIDHLAECRVVQHVPKKMGGLAGLEENTRGITAIKVPDSTPATGKKNKEPKPNIIWDYKSGEPLPVLDNLDDITVELQQYGPRDPKDQDRRKRKKTEEKAAKLLGLRPKNGDGKLHVIKGVRVVNANFGLALWRKNGQPEGEVQTRVILWHKVWPQLKAIVDHENGGKWPQVLRNGQIIHIPTAKGRSDYRGKWRICSIKNSESGLAFDMVRPDMTKARDGVDWARRNVSVLTLVKCGMQIVSCGLTGVNLKE